MPNHPGQLPAHALEIKVMIFINKNYLPISHFKVNLNKENAQVEKRANEPTDHYLSRFSSFNVI